MKKRGRLAIPARSSARAVPPARTQTLSIKAVLQQGAQLLETEGVHAACGFMEQLAAHSTAPVIEPARLLTDLALTTYRQHPHRAVGVVERALQIEPGLQPAWVAAAAIYDRIQKKTQARDAALKVIDNPDSSPDMRLHVAGVLERTGERSKAWAAAIESFDALGRPQKFAAQVLALAQRLAHWNEAKTLQDQLMAAYMAGDFVHCETPRVNVNWCDDEAVNLRLIQEWSQKNLPMLGTLPPKPLMPLQGRRLRVGYLSSDYREHPTARLINGLLRNHDRARLELFMYDSGWDDQSAMRREVERHFDHIHSLEGLSDRQAAELIRSHGVDVLVELNGPTRAHRMGVLAWRPAPVQIDYLGWPGSVGGRIVDYIVGDAYTVPAGAEAAYPEKIIRLHQTYQVNDYASRALPPMPTRQAVGLPPGDNIRVLGAFNALIKVHSEVWATWMTILNQTPNAVMWLLDPGPGARENLAQGCRDHGVDPNRVVLAKPVPQDQHLARIQCCDLLLDPWPYGGHTTTSDALFAGVPVIALEGRNFAGRVSGGLLRAAGLGVLVQPTLERYIQLAVHLMRTPTELVRMQRYVREQVPKSDIFNAKGKARQFEAAYRLAYERALAGLPPVHINLAPDRKRSAGHAA